MNYNLSVREELIIFNDQVKWFIQNRKEVTLEPFKHTRTNKQNAARWKYLSQIASILNERGETFQVKGMKIECPYTKDNLYHMYWQTLRESMYPGKTKQLNIKEFLDLADMAGMMFAKIFDIHIPFPNKEELNKSVK